MMTAKELRDKYLEFFSAKGGSASGGELGHTIIPSASLIPENDPSVLFTTAGMHPLVPYLLGEKHPGGKRLANVQKCVRTGDIDEVGDRTHHTFFEMLGNWSLGDYFKKESIEMSWEFLTSPQWLGLDKNRIAVSVFKGDEDAPFDAEAFEIWKNLGMSEKKIAKLPKENNWWGMETGPCGPDTEIFYWVGDPNQVPDSFNDDNALWVEIWNNVFMQYNKMKDGSLQPLIQQNVDTGMGMERILSAVNGLSDNYQSELFWPIIEKISTLTTKNYQEEAKSYRIIADHLRAATFILGDDKAIPPSNVGQGYIIRRLIRRAIRYGKLLNIENNFTVEIARIVVNTYRDTYLELEKNKGRIFEELEKEENKFRKTLEQGIKRLKYLIELNKEKIDTKDAFDLYQTYGFPIEMTLEVAKENNLEVDVAGFQEELKKHQELSRTASAGMFKGGLASMGEQEVKYHTATHLLHAALRKVLGEHVFQKGSNITAERLRFDFSHPDKMSDEQKKQVEDLVNSAIEQKLPVSWEEMTVEEAKAKNAIGVFGEKYGDKVKVYTVGNSEAPFSREICGGPHVENTGVLGKFRIQKEEASSAGVRRIKAVLT